MHPDKELLIKLAQSDRDGLTAAEPEQLHRLNRRVVDRPLIMVNTSTAGKVPGAGETWKAIGQYLEERGIEADLRETGSIGISSEEPVVSVQIPGRTRLFFKRITADLVPVLLDDLFHMVIPDEMVIGQLRREGQEPWDEVRFLDEIPFLALQERIVMKHCGIIDPFSLGEYMGSGGYAAFLRVIRQYTFAEVCGMVARSGLRGRSGGGFPTGMKWKVAFDTPSDQKYLICNAEESDPGAFMDRTLMDGGSLQRLEGMAIGAYVNGSNRAYL